MHPIPVKVPEIVLHSRTHEQPARRTCLGKRHKLNLNGYVQPYPGAFGEGGVMKKINYSKYYWQNDLVRFRGMLPEDWEESYYNRFDSEARRRLQSGIELPPTIQADKEAVEKYANFGSAAERTMFVIENLNGECVGAVNLNSIDEKNGTFGIGIQIGMDHRGRGYGTAAMRLLLKYAFFERRLHKFNACVIAGNTASEKMMENLGCRQEGIRREQIYTDGRYHDEILYGLTAGEYQVR